jgi:hypothetical protein
MYRREMVSAGLSNVGRRPQCLGGGEAEPESARRCPAADEGGDVRRRAAGDSNEHTAITV